MTEQIPGDGIDNDGDGLVDEEYCGFLWEGKTYSSNSIILNDKEHTVGCDQSAEDAPALHLILFFIFAEVRVCSSIVLCLYFSFGLWILWNSLTTFHIQTIIITDKVVS